MKRMCLFMVENKECYFQVEPFKDQEQKWVLVRFLMLFVFVLNVSKCLNDLD